MNRKVAFIVILVVISLVIGGLAGFYFYTKQKNPAPTILGRDTSGRNFANYDPNNTNTNTRTSTNTTVVITGGLAPEVIIPRLRRISDVPVAGSDYVNIDIYASTTGQTAPRVIGTREVIRFIERATGHIFETSTTSVTNLRISNTTIPKIYEAFFVGRGDSLVLRDLIGGTDIIRSRYANLTLASTTETEKILTTSDLRVNLLQTVRSPNRAQLFSVEKDGISGFLSSVDGGAIQTVLDIPFKEWLVQWPERRSIILTTKPSGFFPGYAYILNPETRSFNRLLGGINGLTINASPDVSKILYSKSEGGSFRMFVFDRRTSQSIDTQFRTLPEKCTWANTEVNTIYCAIPEDVAFNTYPDVWYQGGITFSDSIWKINIDTLEARLISKLQDEAGQIIDVQSIQINPADDYLLLNNKITLELWGLRLKDLPKKALDPLSIVGTSTSSTGTTSTTTTTR